MMRIVVLGQPGAFGSACCRHAAARLAQRLDLPCMAGAGAPPDLTREAGWVAMATVGAVSDALLRAADTTVWLHYSPLAVLRAWVRRLRERPAGQGREAQLRPATRGATDAPHDLALLRIEGAPLPPLAVRDSDGVREGEAILFTGYPIGNVLGPHPATHRGMVAAITPIAIPPANSAQLDPRMIRQLARAARSRCSSSTRPPTAATAGSPVYAPATGEVIGVVNMVFVKGSKEAALTQPSGITYAIPSRHVTELLRQGGR